jgi:hypothetical protein
MNNLREPECEEVICENPHGVECNEKSEYKQSRGEILRQHEVRILFLSLGCVIEVGCKKIPFTTIKEGMKALNDYVTKPYETAKIFDKKLEGGEL